MRDYYEVLGVSKDADAAALKRAFREKALAFHPDRNTSADAEAKFKEANEAYAVLSDPARRARYDQFGHAGVAQDGQPFQGGYRPEDLRDIFGGDIFDQLFGAFFRRDPRRHGRDIHLKYEIDLETVAAGARREITFQRAHRCEQCGGSGCAPGTHPERCGTCGGMGQVRRGRGLFVMPETCPTCEGVGVIIPSACTSCGGRGVRTTDVTLAIPIPAGVDTGQTLRLDGEAHCGVRGGQAGDLYIELEVSAHPFFERNNVDIICERPISFPQAALGTSIDVPTLAGRAQVKVPSGTQSGQLLRLKGKGLPSPHGRAHGDQLIRIVVETPKRLTQEQRDLLESLETSLTGTTEHLALRRSFLQKLKDFFE
ncbi:MAG: molecular chaperone DnaJ [Myxococcota bacterium]|nr:molecular chaperone DnaJ [Myxococcota bacterium]